jgi:hypothetical protein
MPKRTQSPGRLSTQIQNILRRSSGLGALALRIASAMKPKKPDGQEPDIIEPALPSWKAFVIQLSHDTTPDSGIFAGRIEHLGSGRRQRFVSGKELLSAVMHLLSELEAAGKGQ